MVKQVEIFYRCMTVFIVLLAPLETLLAQELAVFDAESARFRAQVEKDGVALQTLLDDDLYYLHSNGLIENKQDFITSVSGGKIVYSQMTASEHRIRLYGKTAVLYGLVMVRGEYKGEPFDIGLYYTSVYRKKRGKWLLVNWQSTKKP
jgi:hypothetical protein